MDSATPDPVDCGRPYGVVLAKGAEVATLGQFVGETMFTIDKDGVESQISGEGVARDGGVRFHEKDALHGKDVRVWQIRRETSGGFSAASTSAF
jgi:hypothetical protein